MDAWLNCTISSGQFSDEFAVSGRDFQGNGFSFFAPANCVRPNSAPPEGAEAPARVLVVILGQRDDLTLVQLPATTFDNGATVTVREDQLAYQAARQIA
jgi:hypothetical protein